MLAKHTPRFINETQMFLCFSGWLEHLLLELDGENVAQKTSVSANLSGSVSLCLRQKSTSPSCPTFVYVFVSHIKCHHGRFAQLLLWRQCSHRAGSESWWKKKNACLEPNRTELSRPGTVWWKSTTAWSRSNLWDLSKKYTSSLQCWIFAVLLWF